MNPVVQARHQGTCSSCGGPIRPGQMIRLVDSGWEHVPCTQWGGLVGLILLVVAFVAVLAVCTDVIFATEVP